jgi:hypothetical protein
MKKFAAVLSLALLALSRSAPAASCANPGDQDAAPRPTPEVAEQHVTIPSLPGEPNKEGTVRTTGEIQTDAAGYPKNSGRAVQPASPEKPGAQAAPGKRPDRSAPSSAQNVPGTTSSLFMMKGTVKAYQPGVSIRIALMKSGRLLSYHLAPDVVAPDDLRLGEVVNVRIVNRGKARAVDRVDRVAKSKVR